MYINVQDRGIIYNGPAGLVLLFDFDHWDAPDGRVSSEALSTDMDETGAVRIASFIADGNFKAACVPLEEVYFDEEHYIDNCERACIVITNDNVPFVFTNIENQEVFATLLASFSMAILEKYEGKIPVPSGDDGEEDYPKIPLTNEELERIKAHSPKVAAMIDKLKHLAKELQEINEVIMQSNSIKFFMDGMTAVTCSSKREYAALMKTLKDNGVILSKSVNKEGWNDVCRYVYCENFKNNGGMTFVAHAHFRMPDTIDQVLPYKVFVRQLNTLLQCANRCDEIQRETMEFRNNLAKL